MRLYSLIAICFLARSVCAAPVTYNFSGSITTYNDHINPSAIALGDAFSGFLTYDTNYGGLDGNGFAYPPGKVAVPDWQINVGGHSWFETFKSPLVQTVYPFNSSSIVNSTTFCDEMPGQSSGSMFLDQGCLTFNFSSSFTGVPADLPVSEFLDGNFTFAGGFGPDSIQGNIDRIAEVPEPTSISLFLSGMVMFFLRSFRSRFFRLRN